MRSVPDDSTAVQLRAFYISFPKRCDCSSCGAHVRFEADRFLRISSWTAAGSFLRAFTNAVTPVGGVMVSQATNTTSVFDACATK